MAKYPGKIYIPRQKENRHGVVFDPTKKSVIFVEDVKGLDDEMVAVQKTLGKNLENVFRNLARGILPIALEWGIPPSDLHKITDGNWATASGTGSSTATGWDILGYIDIDLGRIQTFLASGRFGVWSTANDVGVAFQTSDDYITWRGWSSSFVYINSRTESIPELFPIVGNGRYLRWIFYISGAGTGYVKIYELIASLIST